MINHTQLFKKQDWNDSFLEYKLKHIGHQQKAWETTKTNNSSSPEFLRSYLNEHHSQVLYDNVQKLFYKTQISEIKLWRPKIAEKRS